MEAESTSITTTRDEHGRKGPTAWWGRWSRSRLAATSRSGVGEQPAEAAEEVAAAGDDDGEERGDDRCPC